MVNKFTPALTVDIIIEIQDWIPWVFGQMRSDGTFEPPVRKNGIVLIERKNEPKGWALPGGFVDLGETTIAAAIREAKEETGLQITHVELLGVYDDPARDPRGHTVSIAYVAKAIGIPKGADDAKNAIVVDPRQLGGFVNELCFDHRRIITDYLVRKA